MPQQRHSSHLLKKALNNSHKTNLSVTYLKFFPKALFDFICGLS